jgi:hypothetical protein
MVGIRKKKRILFLQEVTEETEAMSREVGEGFEGVLTSLPSEPSRDNPWFGWEGTERRRF